MDLLLPVSLPGSGVSVCARAHVCVLMIYIIPHSPWAPLYQNMPKRPTLILSAPNLLIFPGELSEDTVSYANTPEQWGKHAAPAPAGPAQPRVRVDRLGICRPACLC